MVGRFGILSFFSLLLLVPLTGRINIFHLSIDWQNPFQKLVS